jgi:hypothetical protein
MKPKENINLQVCGDLSQIRVILLLNWTKSAIEGRMEPPKLIGISVINIAANNAYNKQQIIKLHNVDKQQHRYSRGKKYG